MNALSLDAATNRDDEIPLATKPTADFPHPDDRYLICFGKESGTLHKMAIIIIQRQEGWY